MASESKRTGVRPLRQGACRKQISLPNTYSWIAHQMDIRTSLGRSHNYIGSIPNLRPFLDSLAQTTLGNIHT